ncbi:MAG: aminoacyl-tRNA deacylase [Caldilineaceae bacterium]|nr:aminoacyl-tRNA deacylase [Caldilineaceae bacterium]
MDFTNNVTRMLEGKRIVYTVHTYPYSEELHSATDVADAIGFPQSQVFKTLVALDVAPGQKPALVVIPGDQSLDLKALAKATGSKKMQMAARAEAERLTGLLAGGISPLALINRGFVVYLDDRAKAFSTIYISAGERGAQVGIGVDDLVKLTRARYVTIA